MLLTGDLEGADYLVRADDEIDSRSIEIEDKCFQQLALQAPVAGDLRQLVAIIKISSELERSADLCVNICKAARRIYGHDIDPVLRGLISKMSEQAQQLYIAALDAFETNDAPKAAAIDDMDSFLDGLHRQFIQEIFESHSREKIDLQVAVQLAVLSSDAALARFKRAYPALDTLSYQRSWQGKMQLVLLLAPFDNASDAKATMAALPAALRASGPFTKAIKTIHSEISARQVSLQSGQQD